MAVRNDKQLKDTRRGPPWREILAQTPALLLVGGLVIYGYLSFCYDRFYGSLGVDPNDVGLTYAGTLGHASGFVVFFLFLISVLPLLLQNTLRTRRDVRNLNTTTSHKRISTISTSLGFVLVVIGVIGGFREPLLAATQAARNVQAGRSVAPITELMLPVLAIHADPVTAEPVGKPEDSPAMKQLKAKKLLYLGQSGGTVLLYDPSVQRAVYVPASSLVLHVANCRAKPPPDPACQ